MAAKKATKAALDVKEATLDIRYDLEASENVKKSSKGHCRTNGGHGAMCHNGQKKILKEDSYFQEYIFVIHSTIFD